jgi:hypothetical protein
MLNSCSREGIAEQDNFKMQSTTADYTGFPAAVQTVVVLLLLTLHGQVTKFGNLTDKLMLLRGYFNYSARYFY